MQVWNCKYKDGNNDKTLIITKQNIRQIKQNKLSNKDKIKERKEGKNGWN